VCVVNVNIEFRSWSKVLPAHGVELGAERWRVISWSSLYIFFFVYQLYRRSKGHVLRIYVTDRITFINIKVILEGFFRLYRKKIGHKFSSQSLVCGHS
jgi:hypothetical protein